MKVTQSHLTLQGPIDYTSPWNSPGQYIGVCSHSPLQGIFPIQGSNPGLPHCRQVLYQLSHQGSPRLPAKHGNLPYMKIFCVSFISFKCPQCRWKTCVYIYIYEQLFCIWTQGFFFFFFCFLKNLSFKWRKITLQCRIGFCHTTMKISHNYTYITFLLSLPLFPTSHPSRSSQSTRLGYLCYWATSHQHCF